jgi:hypothetical protein
MTERKVWASLSMIAGLIILVWWVSSEWGFLGLFNDCWIGGFCFVLMIPGTVGLILIIVGFINILKRGGGNNENS